MRQRAKGVSEGVDGLVLLVVGASHFKPICRRLQNGVESIDVDSSRRRTGERVFGGPIDIAIIFMYEELKRVYGELKKKKREYNTNVGSE
jgi:hypothetical protein